MKKINMNYTVAALVACSASLSQGALTSWTGGAGDGDWDNNGNWSALKPIEFTGGTNDAITNRTSGVTIDGSLPSQPSSNIPIAFDAFTTPNITLSGGATLSLISERGNGGTGHAQGGLASEIVNVSGTGSHLTLTGKGGTEFQLSREADGTEIWNVSNGGKVTLLASTRTDMSFNSSRLTEMNLDNGTIEISSGQVYGSRGTGGFTSSIKNFVSLDNGSLMNYAGLFQGNMMNGAEATLNFDFADTGSIVRFKNGGVFTNQTAIEAAFGTTFTTSLAGLEANDIGGGYWEVTAVPEPSSAALLGLGGLALMLRRRK